MDNSNNDDFLNDKNELFAHIDRIIEYGHLDFNIDFIKTDICNLIVRNKNNQNMKFIREDLISDVNEFIDDEDYETNLDYIIGKLQYRFVEYNYTKGEVNEDIYCTKRVKAVLEELPKILFLKFDEKYDCSTILDFIMSENDYDNLDLALKIIEKEKKDINEMLTYCNNYTKDNILLYISNKQSSI